MEISAGQQVCLLWETGLSTDRLQQCFQDLSSLVGKDGRVQLENNDRFLLAQHSPSTFDVVLTGHLSPACLHHSSEVLTEIAKILKPSGQLWLSEPIITEQDSSQLRTPHSLASALKLAGFIDVENMETKVYSSEDSKKIQDAFKTASVVSCCKVRGKKPSYEVGATTQLKLSFGKKKETSKVVDSQTQKVWSLSTMDMMDDDVELIDTDDLLDESDLKRPDPESLRVCGTTGKRKACKNCSCGLAEELDNEAQSKQNKQTSSKPTSACGSCYLGDAFRCASCPYLGMPAFKPGEKVVISNS